MSLSDRELAKNQVMDKLTGEELTILRKEYSEKLDRIRVFTYSPEVIAALLAERDQLAIKEKDDAVREALVKAAQTVENLVSKTCGHEEVRIQNDAFKISAYEIRALIEPKD